MAFSVITEQVEIVDLSESRKNEIVTEMQKNAFLTKVLEDVHKGYGMDGTDYNGDDVLVELVRMPVDTSEAYSALSMVISESLWDVNIKVRNLEHFRETLTKIPTVINTPQE